MEQVTRIQQFVIDKVREKRIKIGWGQVDLAVNLEVSEGFIADIESTKRNAKYNLNHINKLAIIFKCSPKDFLPDTPFATPTDDEQAH